METIGEKIINLRLYSRKACISAGDNSKTAVGLKEQLLCLLLKKNLAPAEIMNTLLITKANVAHLSDSMIKEGLMVKMVSLRDRRQIEYRITQKGIDEITIKIDKITAAFKNILTNEKEAEDAAKCLDEVIRIMSFL